MAAGKIKIIVILSILAPSFTSFGLHYPTNLSFFKNKQRKTFSFLLEKDINRTEDAQSGMGLGLIIMATATLTLSALPYIAFTDFDYWVGAGASIAGLFSVVPILQYVDPNSAGQVQTVAFLAICAWVGAPWFMAHQTGKPRWSTFIEDNKHFISYEFSF